MRYAVSVIVLAVIVGAIATSNHLPALSELATVALLAGLIMAGRALWQRRTAKREAQRDPRL